MNEFMAAAVKSAKEGLKKGEGGPFGAAIVKGGKIIAVKHNMVLKTNDPTTHAEIEAIRAASAALGRFDLSDCELYTTTEPCPMCLGAVYWARIKKVFYGSDKNDALKIGFDDKKFYDYLLNNNRNNRELEMVSIDRESCLALFEVWENKAEKIMY